MQRTRRLPRPLLAGLVLAGLALALLVCAGLAWRKRSGSLLARLHASTLVAAGLALVWFAWYWNLLGFKL